MMPTRWYGTPWRSRSVSARLTTFIVVGAGRWIYGTAMGSSGAALDAALIYSNITFAGAILIWLFNSLASVIRGTGNMNVPAGVSVVGTIVLIPASLVLIFGWGPIPAFGVAGGAIAGLSYYAVGCVVLIFYIWTRRGVLTPSPTPPALHWRLSRDILRIGLVACIITVTTNLTVAVATALVCSQRSRRDRRLRCRRAAGISADPDRVRLRRATRRDGRDRRWRRPT